MTLVEKIAALIDPSEFPGLPGHQQGECQFCDENRDHARAKAIEVIKAMREPSEAMVDAGEADGGHSCYRWTAMIDAALKEHEDASK